MNQEDTAWKEILDNYIDEFFALCIPSFYQKIDWYKGWESLDKELNTIAKDDIGGKRIVDKLVKVFLKTGIEQIIIIHLGVQGSPDKDFSRRMFYYHTRLLDKYNRPIFSCAILTDDNPLWRPSFYEAGFADTKIRLDFVTVKLIDYRSRIEVLGSSHNPFACVILAQLAAIDAKKKSQPERADLKFALTRKLYEKGFSKKQIKELYLFLDWLIDLPKELESVYHNKIYEFEESTKMPYISNAERFGIEKGIQQGVTQGQVKIVTQFISKKFGPMPQAFQTKLMNANEEQLLNLLNRIYIAQTIEEVFE